MFMKNQVRHNPVPVALVGLGMLWVIKQSVEIHKQRLEKSEIVGAEGCRTADEVFSDYRRKEGVGKETHKNLGILCGWKEEAGSRVHRWKEKTNRHVENLMGTIKGEVTEARNAFVQQHHQHVWISGACMFALGAAVAAVFPRTRREDQWMGGLRDTLREGAKLRLHATVEIVKQEMRQTAEKILNEICTCTAQHDIKS